MTALAYVADAANRAGNGAPAARATFAEPGNPASLNLDDLIFAIERLGDDPGRETAIALYRAWIAGQAPGHPHLFAAWFNLGAELTRAGDREGALEAYTATLVLRPGFYPAVVNIGLTQEALGRHEAALEGWSQALQPDEERTVLLNHRGRLLEQLGRLEEAEEALRASLMVNPRQPDVIQHCVHIRQKLCRWPILSAGLPGLSPAELLLDSGPLAVLALTDDIDVQRGVTARWTHRKMAPAPLRLAPTGGYRHDRLRIGYLSSDFCSHAMSYLIAEMLEAHDRSRFTVHGYCSSPEDGSPIRSRIVAAFDVHRRIGALSDEAAARLIRADEVDILVDLNGLTAGARLQVLRWRPAPIQATYLGFIGPVPVAEIDYMFCDDFVVPPAWASHYAPAPLPIAALYQANDRKRTIGAPMSRAEAGLPEDRFVLCCMSNSYKITEQMFGAWMAIMRRAPNTVLWLVRDRDAVCRTLGERAQAAGVAPGRLLFADRVAPDRYMARLACADLFLDTFPYNAGTIASDALRMGLPLLTLCGRAFAARMAARLLSALGAERGIASSFDAYVETAVALATDAAGYAAYRALFTPEAWAGSLGDTVGFMAQYEATLMRLQDGLTAAGAQPIGRLRGPIPPGGYAPWTPTKG
jgi:predicted O-linked N-acetylglucosamine transferase (SPINDLY family)